MSEALVVHEYWCWQLGQDGSVRGNSLVGLAQGRAACPAGCEAVNKYQWLKKADKVFYGKH